MKKKLSQKSSHIPLVDIHFRRLFRSALYVYIYNNIFYFSKSIFLFFLFPYKGINKYIYISFFYLLFESQGQKKSSQFLEWEVSRVLFLLLTRGFDRLYDIGKSRFILDLTHMIEVSSKFVCCLARISQPRGDLNPERGFIL